MVFTVARISRMFASSVYLSSHTPNWYIWWCLWSLVIRSLYSCREGSCTCKPQPQTASTLDCAGKIVKRSNQQKQSPRKQSTTTKTSITIDCYPTTRLFRTLTDFISMFHSQHPQSTDFVDNAVSNVAALQCGPQAPKSFRALSDSIRLVD